MNFWQGIVEDNKTDPLKMGRVKVRIFGLHTESRSLDDYNNKYPVDDLPWAMPAFSISSPTISQECNFAVPQQGSIVVGFFIDPDQQQPIYFATIPRIANAQPDFSNGFSDPDGVYPKQDFLGISPISKLATTEDIANTIIQTKKDTTETGNCGNGVTFNEPPTPYNSVYPKNKVIQTESGHVIEIDDSPGSERIHVYHKSGTFDEVHNDGKRIERNVADKYEIDLASRNVLVKGVENVSVIGSRTTKIDNTEYHETGNDQTVEINGAQNIHVTGNINITCDATVNITAAADVNIDGGSGTLGGVVTSNHICAFTGNTHGDYSGDVKASKG